MEQVLLDGGAAAQRSPASQRRSVSPTTSEELQSSGDDGGSSSSSSRGGSPAAPTRNGAASTIAASRTAGPQTGVKGVRADAKYVAQHDRKQRADEVHATNARMQAMALGTSRTWKEDDEERKLEAALATSRRPGLAKHASTSEDDDDDDFDEEAELELIRQQRLQMIKSQEAANESRRRRMAGEDGDRPNSRGGGGGLCTNAGYNPLRSTFGHLREIGPDQFTQAIDSVDASTYIVVHIYVKYVHACAQLTSALSSLARMHTNTKFLQIRAGSIGFGSNGGADADADEDDLDDAAEEVVPTMLVYKAGKVVANLVRVDLDEGWGSGSERSVRDILQTHNALH